MHQEVHQIRTRNRVAHWPQYLNSIRLTNLHGWTGQQVRFDFPFSVICGENGTGKSTLLKAAASIYRHPTTPALSFTAARFFPDTPWETIVNAEISAEYRLGTTTRTMNVRKPTRRWRGADRPSRRVFWYDISRTMPKEAVVGYAQIANRNTAEIATDDLSPSVRAYYSAILGRNYTAARHANTDVAPGKHVGVVDCFGITYSQFHQGAGESCSLDLLAELQNAPDHSLIIIDEIEASLHPSAQRRLVHFLLWLCRTKQCQIIATTHSPFVLEELPHEARTLLVRTQDGLQCVPGAASNYALGRMDTHFHPDLYVFVEDGEAEAMVAEILRNAGADLSRFGIRPIGPHSAVAAVGQIVERGQLPYASACVVDGDLQVPRGCIKLPGTEAPERVVFNTITAHTAELATILGMSAASVSASIQAAMTIPDHHSWIGELARQLRSSNDYIWISMLRVWIRNSANTTEINQFAQELIDLLPA